MPVTDPGTGRAFIWGISSFLFLSIAAGGACLALYMVLPETPTTSWLPTAGVALVGLPWLFWLFTFLYRVISRVFGFRLGVDCGGGGNENDVEPSAVAADDHESPAENNGETRRVQFEAAVTVHENNGDDDHDRCGDRHDQDRNKHSNVSSSSNSSIMSHESEMPLASSMAS